jgi:hypothetical protein
MNALAQPEEVFATTTLVLDRVGKAPHQMNSVAAFSWRGGGVAVRLRGAKRIERAAVVFHVDRDHTGLKREGDPSRVFATVPASMLDEVGEEFVQREIQREDGLPRQVVALAKAFDDPAQSIQLRVPGREVK